ncbi:hypothetical protein HELRODRAFT_185541 [Helobdella robusta]|uniref:Protein elav n=1 Tax=Helobdella robusta TaxID=6412 RepID=T1FMY4_HELRO|nr:hypothetical protein HELRODRAFT_185541 [Helobdella robusta]ESO04987.1 hypothetical protein HELRODRAFT_185541 [Helobdella robusta]
MDSHQELNDEDNLEIDESLTNLIVNYLPQTMSQDDLKSLFSSLGELESCKLIRDKATGMSLGYGFVNYKNPDDAQKALQTLSGLRLQNKTIKVSLARPSSETIKGANLYVSGISKNWQVTELDNLFKPYGQIITSRILSDPQTGLSKGVGFVRFDTRPEAEAAIKQLNGTIPTGTTEPITVKFANTPSASTAKTPPVTQLPIQAVAAVGVSPATVQTASYLAPTRRLVGPIHHQAARVRYSPLENPLTSYTNGIISGASNTSLSTTGFCLFVYNLAPETDESVLWQLFGPFGAVQNVKVMRDASTKKCKGFGFVTMTNYDEALLAITALNGYPINNRPLQVSFKKAKGGTVLQQAVSHSVASAALSTPTIMTIPTLQ